MPWLNLLFGKSREKKRPGDSGCGCGNRDEGTEYRNVREVLGVSMGSGGSTPFRTPQSIPQQALMGLNRSVAFPLDLRELTFDLREFGQNSPPYQSSHTLLNFLQHHGKDHGRWTAANTKKTVMV